MIKYIERFERRKEIKIRIFICAIFVFGLILFLIGLALVFASIGALIPCVAPHIDAFFAWLKTAHSLTGESTLALIAVLLAIAAVALSGGIAIMKFCYKKLTGGQQKEKRDHKDDITDDKQAVA